MALGDLVIRLSADMAEFRNDMGKAVATTQTSMAKIDASVDGMAKNMRRTLQGAVAGIGVGAFAGFIKSSIDAADAMNDLSQRTGVAIRDLAAYKLAAQQSGTSLESVAKGIKGLGAAMSENGTALRAAGISAKDANGALRQTADLFAAMPDGIEKTQLAVKMFGKAGMELIPMLNQGSKGLDDSARAAAKYAAVMAAVAPDADKFNDQVAELSIFAEAAGVSIAQHFLPGLIGLSQMLTDVASGGTKARQALEFFEKSDSPLTRGLAKFAAAVRGTSGSNGGDNGWKLAGMDPKTGQAEIKPPKIDTAAFDAKEKELRDRVKKLMAALGITDGDAKKAADEFAAVINKIYAKDAGLDASYWRDLKTLETAWRAGTMTVGEYADAVGKLTTAQKFHQDTLKAEADAIKESNRATTQAAEVAQRRIDSLNEAADKAQAELDTYGMTKSAIEETTLARLEEQLRIEAAGEARADVLQDLEDEIIARRKVAAAMKGIEAKDAAKKAAEEASKAWEKFADDIERALTDSLMRGFEEGKGFGESFVDSLRNTLKTAALKIVVQAIVDPVMGGVRGALSSAVGGAGGGGNLGSLGSSLIPAGTLGYGIASAGTYLGSAALGNFGAGMMAGQIGGFSAASGVTAAAGSGSAASIGASVGAAMPYIAAAVAAYSLLASSGETRAGGRYAIGTTDIYGTQGTDRATFEHGPSGGQFQGTGDVVYQTFSGINQLLKQLGSSSYLTGFQAGSETSGNGRGGVFSGGILNTGARFGEAGEGSNYHGGVFENTSSKNGDAATIIKNFSDDLLQVTIQALQAAEDIPANIASYLEGINSESLTGDMAAQVIATVTAIDQLGDALEAMGKPAALASKELLDAFGGLEGFSARIGTYYDVMYTEEEKRARLAEQVGDAFEALNLALPTTREGFRDLVDAQDLTTAAGRAAYVSLLDLAPAFAAVSEAVVDTTTTAANAAQASRVSQDYGRALLEASGDTSGLNEFNKALQDAALLANGWTQAQIDAVDAAREAGEAARAAEADAANATRVSQEYARSLLEAAGDSVGLAAFDKALQDAALLANGWTQAQIDATDAARTLAEATRQQTEAAAAAAEAAATAARVSQDYNRAMLSATGDSVGLAAFDKGLKDASLLANGWTQAQIDAIDAARTLTESLAQIAQAAQIAQEAFAAETERLRAQAQQVDQDFARAMLDANGDSVGLAAFDKALNDAALLANGWTQAQIDAIDAARTLTEALAAAAAAAEAAAEAARANRARDQAFMDEQAARTAQTLAGRAGWQERLDVATGARTSTDVSLSRDLASTTDETTRAIIRQVYAQQELNAANDAARIADEKAAAALAETLKVRQSWQDRLDVVNGTTTERDLALARDLAATTDDATKALIRQVYAQEALATAAENSATALRTASDNALAGVARAVDSQKQIVAASYDAQIANAEAQRNRQADSYSTLIDSARGKVSDATTLAAAVKSALNKSTGDSRELTLASRNSALELIRSSALAPDLKGSDALTAALDDITRPAEQFYSSSLEYAQAQAAAADALTALDNSTSARKSVAEMTLKATEDAAKAAADASDAQIRELQASRDATLAALDAQLAEARTQVDVLRGMDVSIVSVATAMAGLTSAISAERSGTGQQSAASAGGGSVSTSGGGGGSSSSSTTVANTSAALTTAVDLNAPATGKTHTAFELRELAKEAYAAFHGKGSFANVIAELGGAAAWGTAFFGVPGAFDAESLRRRYSFAVGTNYVPYDMVAQVHEGEAIIPRAYNPTAGGRMAGQADLLDEIRLLRNEVAQLRADNSAENIAIAQSTAKTSRTLERVIPDGDALAVRTAA